MNALDPHHLLETALQRSKREFTETEGSFRCELQGDDAAAPAARLSFSASGGPLARLEMTLALPQRPDAALLPLYEEFDSLNARGFSCTLRRDPASGGLQIRSFVLAGKSPLGDCLAGAITTVSTPRQAASWVQICCACAERLVEAYLAG